MFVQSLTATSTAVSVSSGSVMFGFYVKGNDRLTNSQPKASPIAAENRTSSTTVMIMVGLTPDLTNILLVMTTGRRQGAWGGNTIWDPIVECRMMLT